MLRIIEDLIRCSLFDDLAAVHDRDAVADACHDAEVMRDHDDAGVDLILKIADELQHLRLDGHIQRGGRFIGDDDLGSHASAIAMMMR